MTAYVAAAGARVRARGRGLHGDAAPARGRRRLLRPGARDHRRAASTLALRGSTEEKQFDEERSAARIGSHPSLKVTASRARRLERCEDSVAPTSRRRRLRTAGCPAAAQRVEPERAERTRHSCNTPPAAAARLDHRAQPDEPRRRRDARPGRSQVSSARIGDAAATSSRPTRSRSSTDLQRAFGPRRRRAAGAPRATRRAARRRRAAGLPARDARASARATGGWPPIRPRSPTGAWRSPGRSTARW